MVIINLDKFIKMLEYGTKSLVIECEFINNLNVFPIPDADTGINLKTTTSFAFNFLKETNISSFKQLSEVYSKQLLLNARGNSGVIFSQIMKGFCETFLDQKELSVDDLKNSFRLAKESAYNAVYNPIEGTILTVIRLIYENISVKDYFNVSELFSDVIKSGQEALEKTKEILPELKKIGVVDSGGYGLLSFLKGMNSVIQENEEDYIKEINKNINQESLFEFSELDKLNEEIGYGYCSEVIIQLNSMIDPSIVDKKWKYDEKYIKRELEKIGDSLVFVKNHDLIKIHIHTLKPYKLLELGQKYGEFQKIKIENMTNQFLEKIREKEYENINLTNQIKIIYTAPTEEIASILVDQFEETNYILTEHATPSIQDFIEKIKQVKSKNILLLLDDTNTVLAAKEAIKFFNNKINIQVISCKNFFEILYILPSFDEEISLLKNKKNLEKTLLKSNSIIINKSIIDYLDSDIKVKKGEKIALYNKKIINSKNTYIDILKWSFDYLITKNDSPDLCYLIYGKNMSMREINEFSEYILEKYGVLTEIKKGNQVGINFYLGII